MSIAYDQDTYNGVMYVTPDPTREWVAGEYFTLSQVAQEFNCKQSEIEQRVGFYKRWTMPGYLDCGDWEPIHDREVTPKSKYYVKPED